jgi:hypothetical protein
MILKSGLYCSFDTLRENLVKVVKEFSGDAKTSDSDSVSGKTRNKKIAILGEKRDIVVFVHIHTYIYIYIHTHVYSDI